MPYVNVFGKTDVGLRRKNNEDTFIVSPDKGYCLVSDGMGGSAAGELASSIFAETALEQFTGEPLINEQEIVNEIKQTFLVANEQILLHVKDNPDHKGMGCTGEIIAFWEQGFVIGHVGDSRSYRHRSGRMTQLTRDHSLVQDQVDQGRLTPEKARTHPYRNVINRAVGISDELSLDILKGKIRPGDIYVLCSDGLTDMVDDDTMQDILNSDLTLEQKTDTLVQTALSAGGRDNVTVVLAEVQNG